MALPLICSVLFLFNILLYPALNEAAIGGLLRPPFCLLCFKRYQKVASNAMQGS